MRGWRREGVRVQLVDWSVVTRAHVPRQAAWVGRGLQRWRGADQREQPRGLAAAAAAGGGGVSNHPGRPVCCSPVRPAACRSPHRQRSRTSTTRLRSPSAGRLSHPAPNRDNGPFLRDGTSSEISTAFAHSKSGARQRTLCDTHIFCAWASRVPSSSRGPAECHHRRRYLVIFEGPVALFLRELDRFVQLACITTTHHSMRACARAFL